MNTKREFQFRTPPGTFLVVVLLQRVLYVRQGLGAGWRTLRTHAVRVERMRVLNEGSHRVTIWNAHTGAPSHRRTQPLSHSGLPGLGEQDESV